jgi:hypothetical protein
MNGIDYCISKRIERFRVVDKCIIFDNKFVEKNIFFERRKKK